MAQLKIAEQPAAASVTASAEEASPRSRVTFGCDGPVPDRVITVTGVPASASWTAMVEPTGPEPITRFGDMSFLHNERAVLTLWILRPPKSKSSALFHIEPSLGLRTMAGTRAAHRMDSIAEIKRLARMQMAEHGPAQLSLRAVAREMGVVSSAVYRYFASRDDLLTALLVDSYDEFGAAVEAADRGVRRSDFTGRWRAVASAMRRWALDHPADYALLFGTPVPGYAAPQDTIGPASRYTTVLLRLLADINAAGIRHPARLPRTLRADLANLPALMGLEIEESSVVVGMAAWATVHGAINLELFGHLRNVVERTDEWFEAVVANEGRRLVGD